MNQKSSCVQPHPSGENDQQHPMGTHYSHICAWARGALTQAWGTEGGGSERENYPETTCDRVPTAGRKCSQGPRRWEGALPRESQLITQLGPPRSLATPKATKHNFKVKNTKQHRKAHSASPDTKAHLTSQVHTETSEGRPNRPGSSQTSVSFTGSAQAGAGTLMETHWAGRW